MTKRLVNELIADGYTKVIRTDDREIGATKASAEIDDDTMFDIFTLYKNETAKDLTIGTLYNLSDLV